MRHKNSLPLADALEQYLISLGADKMLKEKRIIRQWQEIAGKTIAKYTDEVTISKGILTVKLRSAAAKNELSMFKQGLIDQVNERAGERLITDIIFI